MRKTIILILTLLLSSCSSQPRTSLQSLKGVDHNNKEIEIKTNKSKATIIVFLSAFCPCSKSHLPLLGKMQEDNKDIQFIGIHSNYNENHAKAKSYFSKSKLNFPVIHDKDSSLAKRIGGLKTPHAFIVDNAGTIIYKGSVTNSSNASKAKENYLLQAINELNNGKAISTPVRKVLGCNIITKN